MVHAPAAAARAGESLRAARVDEVFAFDRQLDLEGFARVR